MSASHVRRGAPARPKARKAAPKRAVKKGEHARANRLAGLAFGAFLLAMGVVVVIALDIPSKAATSAGSVVGRAGFTVSGYQIVGLNRMDRKLADAVIVDELRRASESAGGSRPAQPLVDVAAIRNRLLQFGWVKDARVSRRLPDTLVIDIVERQPVALWQDRQRLALIDGEGVVLDRVRVDQMPDLPLLIGPGANARARELDRLMGAVPTLKPQLASATWIGRRRWDLAFQTGETVALPEGEAAARRALVKFASVDRSSGLLGRGLVRFDLRIPGKMTVRLPRAPGEAIVPDAPAEG